MYVENSALLVSNIRVYFLYYLHFNFKRQNKSQFTTLYHKRNVGLQCSPNSSHNDVQHNCSISYHDYNVLNMAITI